MKILGFVICRTNMFKIYTKDKIYPYYEINGPDAAWGYDYRIKICDDYGNLMRKWMGLEDKIQNGHHFDFITLPEFPKDINQWTEDDWFQYDLKYGE